MSISWGKTEDLVLGEGALSDGERVISYSSLPSIFASLRTQLADAGLGAADRVELLCDNDVASATALLLFVGDRRNALLASHADSSAPMSPHCGARVSARPTARGGVTLAIERNAVRPVDVEPGIAVATSGTTGKCKLALFRHAALLANACGCIARLELDAYDKVAIPVPLFHMYGLGAAFLPALLAGASVDLQPRSNALRFVARERTADPNVAFLTPSFAAQLLTARHGPRAYRLTVVAGDRMPESTFSRYEDRHGPVCGLYGATELGAVAASSPRDARDARATSVGLPLEGVELALREATGGASALWVRHSACCAGYLDVGGRLVPLDLEDGWYRTPDHAETLSGGELRLLGRADDAVKRDGVLVRLRDVEAKLSELSFVERVAVISGGDTPRGASLVACVVPRGSMRVDALAARRAAKALLPSHAVPDRFVVLPVLPLLESGKVDRRSLSGMHLELEARST